MRRWSNISCIALLVCGTAPCPAQTSSARPAAWLLSFDGKSTNALALDRRFPAFLSTHITHRATKYWIDKPTIPARDAVEFLHGPPDDVHVVDRRYLTASACVAHDATDCGLLWVDVQTGATVFAASVYAVPTPIATNRVHLWLFTNATMKPSAQPTTLTSAIAQWSARSNGDGSHTLITDVTLVQPDGKQSKLQPADVHAWTTTATTGK